MQHGCPNQESLLAILEGLRREGRPHGLLRCSFRNYNTVLAIHGTAEADRLLAAGQARLSSACPAGSSLVRLQNAELAIVVPGTANSAELLELGEHCTKGCRALELSPSAMPLLLQVAIGAALADCRSMQQSSQDLINQALLARLEAEQHPGNHLVLAPNQIQQLAAERYQLESDLRLALERKQLTTHLQPIVDLRSGSAIGFECLARWPDADGVATAPASFMAAANAAGLTADIDLQVLTLALEAAESLATAAGACAQRPLILSSNLSGQLIENPARILELLELIRSHPLPNGVQLQLELLEEAFNNTAYDLDALLDWLAEQKVLIAIDDFGTGYSSLSRLHELSINTIKVDRSFVQRINAPDKPSNHLLQTLVAIARDLQLDLTAEGIDSDEQRQWLLSQGVHHGQGFLFSKPLSLDSAIGYLEHQHR